MDEPRFVVGIDLGTTGSAVAYAPIAGKVGVAPEIAPVWQVVAPGEIAARSTLPSFLYLPAPGELPEGSLALPWAASGSDVVGEHARVLGALAPARLVSSAKSWLSHDRVDRTAAILPWGAASDVPRLSPVDASRRYLEHLRSSWDHHVAPRLAEARLADQEIILTVPASFDAVARELTVQAAVAAGLEGVTLLEEPQAAFYALLAHPDGEAELGRLGDEAQVVVCDVGGGTTDFTLVRVRRSPSAGLELERIAVGDHLLLGGDNMDLALARRVEPHLGNGSLDPHDFAALVHAVRLAKEALLAPGGATSRPVTLPGRGSRVIAGTRTAILTHDQVRDAILDGFFPRLSSDAEPERRRRGGLGEWGLPYERDTAITRHLASFLRRHDARPAALLVNGGPLAVPALVDRLRETIAGLSMAGDRCVVLTSHEPSLAVARGAAYYGLVRRGHGRRIRGGAARAVYLEVEAGRGADAERSTALCLVPRGLEEGAEVEVATERLAVMVGRPVRFGAWTSSTRTDAPGDVVTLSPTDADRLPPLCTVLATRRPAAGGVTPVRLRARSTALGTLDLACEAPAVGERWHLEFDLDGRRAETGPGEADTERGAAFVPSQRITDASRILYDVFTGALPPTGAMKRIESALGFGRNDVPVSVLRALWEPLRDLRGERGRSAAHEERWLHLAGFLLRPGFGYPLDDWRVREVWRLFGAPLLFEKSTAVRVQSWILWRRIAGGLRRGQQEEIAKRVLPHLLPGSARGHRKPPPPEEAAELWRVAGSLEHLPVETKIRLGESLLARLEKCSAPLPALWTVGRLGARVPLHGRADNVVAPALAERWLERLLDLGGVPPEELAFALALVARRSGDRVRDVGETIRLAVLDRLERTAADPSLIRLVHEAVIATASFERVALGDTLPSGLVLRAEG